MPLFKRKSPSNSNSNSNSASNPTPSYSSSGRSVEHLVHPAFDGRIQQQQLQPPQQAQPPPQTQQHPEYDPRFAYQEGPGVQNRSQPEVQSSSLHRSQSQRQPHLQQRDRPTVSVVAPEPQPQPRPRRGLFVRPSSGVLDRSSSVSIKGKLISHPISQPASPQVPFNTSDELVARRSYEDQPPAATHSYEPRSASLAYQQQQQQQQQQHRQPSREQNERSPQSQHPSQQLPASTDQPYPRPLVRSNTDPNLLAHSNQPSPTELELEPAPESPRHFDGYRGQPQRSQQDLVLNPRPPSRQFYEPSSPIRSKFHPDAMQQASAQAPQPSNDQPSGSNSRRGSNTQIMPDQPGRQTPTNNRQREDLGDIDVRALLQKHEELQTKYSKVKRYYFDKEAQVQHLQNTVAHQRMAVSRTVLDDNEYANRFQRLDGAIKDLAFSVRKDWRSVPAWLHGLVTDDAVKTGTKEMTALGRAVISKWLGEEVFHKHFHPGLDPALSMALKNIEMNLRRQQMRPCTDEDRENAIARLSNWRRTTFDGLGDALSTPDAQEHRAELIEHLIAELASFLSTQLNDPALPGLEAGVRMIIENTINIAEKIPLEARDVYVEYLPTNITFTDAFMRVEGQLPPLTHQPPPPADEEPEDPATAEGDSSPASNSTGTGEGTSPAPREPKKKSVFDALRNRKSAGPEQGRPAAGHPHDEKADQPEVASPPRIRFSSFLTVEVRGKGSAMVLAKAPVWLIE